MARSYPYGKVPSSVGTVISERFETPMVCCGYCSTHFAMAAAKAGFSRSGRVEGHKVRSLGGRKHNAGSTAAEQRLGAKRGYNITLTGITKAAVPARVRAGYAVTISIAYAKMPGYLKVQTNDFGHCVTLKGYRVVGSTLYVGVFDPLWLQGSQGTWAKWTDIDQALWSSGHNTTTTKR
jgi:hypothetical protein